MRVTLLAAVSIMVLGACATGDGAGPADSDPRLARLTSDRLEKFGSEREFADYLKRVRTIAKERGAWWAGEPVQYASLEQQQPPPCDPTLDDCETGKDPVVVTGSRMPSASIAMPVTAVTSETSGADVTITNVQKAGVDEGDIVKRIGKHLVVLQDGRLFSVNMEALTLSDRSNVYAGDIDDAWYDEILVSGNRVLVTGYNYMEDATQLTVMAMDAEGRFTREGTFFLSSGDYYDTSNYATRLVGDQLVIYSPLDLTELRPEDAVTYPVVRRWSPQPASAGAPRQLFNARDIYRPVQDTLYPMVHTISFCDLGVEAVKKDLSCRTTAFVGPPNRTFYVSPDDVFVWLAGGEYVWDETCHAGKALAFNDGPKSSVFRIPVSDAKPGVMHTRGAPLDQFSMDSFRGEFRALLYWGRTDCNPRKDDGEAQLKYFSAPMSMFRDDVRTASQARYAQAPSLGPDVHAFENRFTDDYVVYGARESYWARSPDQEDPAKTARVVALPVKRPGDAVMMTAPHDVSRIERLGADIVTTGYQDWKGLSVSMIDLDAAPRIADTVKMEGRYESEGRSHAFNARLDADRSGVMGIPTVAVPAESYRFWWRSEESDVSFLTYDKDGRIALAGDLLAGKDTVDPSYTCEVSCIDWYGNSRPSFIGERIYALSGTEIIEGRLAEGKVMEVRRVNLTAPVK